MWKVISPRSCRESAQLLQTTLNEMYPRHQQPEKIINWGNSSVSMHNPVDIFGNKLEAVQRSANKILTFKLCKHLGTVPQIQGGYDGPCFIHTNPLGQNGSGVVFCDKEEDFIGGHFTTKQIKGKEFRTYFAYGSVIGIFKKVQVEGDSQSLVRNSHNGWGYLSSPPELNRIKDLKKYLKELTLDVSNALELSYGAVDIILEDDTHKLYILEANSAPTLITLDLVEQLVTKLNNHYYYF